ncbi:2-amino-4-hydroxy-6-hydroxymethyldihydropteridine diphosphokinase [Endozoicomonas sp. SM1973]|uniref:2-amino-4-hydroxy-6-hydroxymethyldihydropteridine pyrophosphokinase n=1 Tax=Spartinivicinus marinus TaxID=2994442 RepID=A0A853IKW7_9GAMM|nr:2-amino-4-hydroxy-6-hydroxymethyldihydropteridine diphosphokinase [Spartinivicinus marinus]MCX4028019.1 2-amino-4-hydroxy-6-hydroxymethyldihydropteridine diphosphokinase [Spartinivicinus marinus]NYZ68356.1 2-amino-4-hydroxy-6-hydroxymethyldihydropteridine diphosphokinase [Spartinivicinus marinus]
MKQAVLLGIGCNVQPMTQIPKILNVLVVRFNQVWLSRLVMTKPVGVKNAADFCNGVLYFYSDLSEQALNEWCKQSEQQVGRAPQDCKSRQVADLDLLWCGPSNQRLDPAALITESYYQQPARDVLTFVDRLAVNTTTLVSQSVDILRVSGPNGEVLGDKPTTIEKQILPSKINGF